MYSNRPLVKSEAMKASSSPRLLFDDERHDGLFLAMIAVVLLVVHAVFRIEGFGEYDACKLAVYGFSWHKFGTDSISIWGSPYPFRTSLVYIWGIKKSLDLGLPVDRVPELMNWFNVLTGSLIVVPLWLIWKRVTDRRTACLGIGLLAFAPAIWQGSIYGMPHMPAFFFLCCSLLCFMGAMQSPLPLKSALVVLSAFLAFLAFGCKADSVLAAGAFLGILLFLPNRNVFSILSVLFVIAVPLITILAFPRLVFHGVLPVNEFAGQWSQSYPFTLRALVDAKNLAATVTSVGCVFSLFIFFTLIAGIPKSKNIRLLLFCLSWSLPAALFWGLKMGNSARHMMVPMTGFLFWAAWVLRHYVKGRALVITVLLLIIGNYLISPAALLPRTYRPSSRLIKANSALQEVTRKRHAIGREFAALPPADKVLMSDDHLFYCFWEIVRQSFNLEYFQSETQRYFVTSNDRIRFVYVPSAQNINEIVDRVASNYPGWELWTIDILDDNTNYRLKKIAE